ncbi:GNAT family N-acetyltransferase [Sphingomonas sp.]|uniref:GNAT family N-acetyltransferase n=1 Tax=Sphingomonas sp. TaxID=28214 RepID=UPI003B3BC27E
MIVRRARTDDVPAILRLIRALAAYERAPDAVHATEQTLAATLFGPDARVFAHVIEIDGEVVGVAVWFLNYSTWTGRPGLYLEDLFVSEAARGTGAGRALFRALAREAVDQGYARIDWAVLDWNEPAKRFYRAIGARRQTGWEPWRLDGEALEAMAR